LGSNGQVKPYPLAGITGSTPFNLELDSLNKAILSSTIDRTDPKVLNILNVFGEPFIDELRSRFGQLRYSIVAVLNRFQSDGSVLLNFQGALQGSFSSSLSILYRFSPEGKFDASYGNNGFLAPLISSFVGSDGDFDQADRIVLAGYDSTANSILVYRGTKNGQLDRSFGINGTATLPPSPNFGGVSTRRSIAVEIDSKKRAVIITKRSDDDFITVFRLDENGLLDNIFGTNGQLKLPAEVGSTARFNLVKLANDNRLLIGSENNPTNFNSDIAFARYDIGGAGAPVTPPKVFTVTPSATDTEILTGFLGVTTGLSNIKLTTTGDRQAIGAFQNDPLSLDKGIVLSTGQVSQLVGANQTDKSNVSTDFNLPGTLPNGHDAITLEITFDADINAKQVFFQYVFGSEEFLDFSGSAFNDIFTLELNGVNLAKLSDGKTASINNLTPSPTPSSFNPDYIDNLVTTNPANSQIVLDGYSKPLRFVGDLIPGASNKLVITIQDISDGALDSAVFLKGGTFGVIDPINTVVGGGLNLSGVNNLNVGATQNLINGAFAVNPSDITLTSNEINLIGGSNSITSPGQNLVLQAFDPNQNIQIGSADSGDSGILDLTDTDLAAIANGFSKITIGRTNGNGSININSSIFFSDPVLLQSPTGQVNINAPVTLTDDATLDLNTKTLVKSGESTLTLNGNNTITFIGSTIINGGSLVLAKSSNINTLNTSIYINAGTLKLGNNEQINNIADLTLNGGTFDLNGFNETLNQLLVTTSSNTVRITLKQY
jgi:autotransporter-associated beta strand protein